ncbi:MAG: GNAT family N-acetyltransferase [Nocardioidaceae bacterium]
MPDVLTATLDPEWLTRHPDPFLELHLGAGHGHRLWSDDTATVVHVPRGDRQALVAVGDPTAVSQVLGVAIAALAADGHDSVRLSVPAAAYDRIDQQWRQTEPSAWEWMWTRSLIGYDQGLGAAGSVAWLDSDELWGVAELLDRHSPRAHARPGDPSVIRWAGVRIDGVLVAAGALTTSEAGVAHLRGIVTAPAARDRGLGTAITAFLTAAALKRDDVVTLGMYSDNDVARGLYERLGYRRSHEWRSAPVQLR